jgi:tetratricopeptide (TPR) repeat protein
MGAWGWAVLAALVGASAAAGAEPVPAGDGAAAVAERPWCVESAAAAVKLVPGASAREKVEPEGDRLFDAGDYRLARLYYEQAEEGRAPRELAVVLYKLALCRYFLGDYEPAFKLLIKVVKLAEEIGRERPDEVRALLDDASRGLVTCYLDYGAPADAYTVFSIVRAGFAREMLVQVVGDYCQSGRRADAVKALKAALAALASSTDEPTMTFCREARAQLSRLQP